MRLLMLIFAVCFARAYCGIVVERTIISPSQRAQGFSCRSSDPHLGLMRAGEERIKYRPNHCGSAKCTSNGDVTLAQCSTVEARLSPHCKLVGDNSKRFPGCCPRLVC